MKLNFLQLIIYVYYTMIYAEFTFFWNVNCSINLSINKSVLWYVSFLNIRLFLFIVIRESKEIFSRLHLLVIVLSLFLTMSASFTIRNLFKNMLFTNFYSSDNRLLGNETFYRNFKSLIISISPNHFFEKYSTISVRRNVSLFFK